MRYIWDKVQRQPNRIKHGLDFADAALVFERPTFTDEDNRHGYIAMIHRFLV
jgi:uncharacterized protein